MNPTTMIMLAAAAFAAYKMFGSGDATGERTLNDAAVAAIVNEAKGNAAALQTLYTQGAAAGKSPEQSLVAFYKTKSLNDADIAALISAYKAAGLVPASAASPGNAPIGITPVPPINTPANLPPVTTTPPATTIAVQSIADQLNREATAAGRSTFNLDEWLWFLQNRVTPTFTVSPNAAGRIREIAGGSGDTQLTLNSFITALAGAYPAYQSGGSLEGYSRWLN